MTSAQSSNTNFSETDFNLLEDSEDADNHTSDTTATRLSLQVQLDEKLLRATYRPSGSHAVE